MAPKNPLPGIDRVYGRWLAFLARREPDALQREPGTRASPALLAAYIDALSQRVTAMSVVAEINHLRHALRAVAPALDQAWIAQLQQRWTKQARPREKRSKMIDARRIYAVGVMLMREATSEPDSLKAARDYRDGFLIALLITRPLRRMNLTQLEFGKHVMPEGDGRALVLDHGTTKSGEPLEFRIRDDLVGYLLQYIKVYRPRFPGADQHSGLWPSSKVAGSVQKPSTIWCVAVPVPPLAGRYLPISFAVLLSQLSLATHPTR